MKTLHAYQGGMFKMKHESVFESPGPSFWEDVDSGSVEFQVMGDELLGDIDSSGVLGMDEDEFSQFEDMSGNYASIV